MNGVRAPMVVGLGAAAGTSTLAAALHARDGGTPTWRTACGADVVVCRAAPASLRNAAELVCVTPGPRPLLAVTLPAAVPDQHATAAALRALQPRFGAVVVLPHVDCWHDLADPLDEAPAVLAQPAEHLTGSLHSYASALRTLVTALVASGLLTRPVPPLLTRATTARPQVVPGLLERPVFRRTPVRPAPVAVPHPVAPVALPRVAPEPEPDDEALEAELGRVGVAAGRAG